MHLEQCGSHGRRREGDGWSDDVQPLPDEVPAYKLARKNESVPLKTVHVDVSSFEVVDFAKIGPSEQIKKLAGGDLAGVRLQRLTFRVQVSAGTYVRSLAHDLGKKLGTGAFLQALCRTRSDK